MSVKKIFIHNGVYHVILVGFLLFSGGPLFSQESAGTGNAPEAKAVDTYVDFLVTYTSDDSVELGASLFIRKERQKIFLENATVSFSAGSEDKIIRMGDILTDSTGPGSLKYPLSAIQPVGDAEGMILYNANFEGNENYLSSAESFSAKPSRLEISFFEEDSIRYIRVNGFQRDASGESVPVAGESVNITVPALFRPLPIGDIYLDEAGTGTMEFPSTLIGDSTGHILVYARISEHDVFGNVVASNTIDWAYPKHLLAAERPTRELWTPVAPLWMIITLLIMLSGVWAHYIYAVIQLIRIKRLAGKGSSPGKIS
jgi:hypothetical protein